MNIDLSALETEMASHTGPVSVAPQMPLIEFYSPLALKSYRPPEGSVLVGENHIVRGATFVIGGAPGVGKSRASVALAVAGATFQPWFGLTVHRRFRTLIIQNENGRTRLSDEFFTLDCESLEGWVSVSAPPPLGMAINNPEFRRMLREKIADFLPDVVLIDPWNSVASDDKARDYLEAFKDLKSLMPCGDNAPALGIVAHTRKPKHDERASGRGLINLLAGSYVLASVPRAVFVLQPGSEQTEDSQVVFTCCKNNDGRLGAQSAWERRNGLFTAVVNFDWDAFGSRSSAPKNFSITEADIATVLAHGTRTVEKAEAIQALLNLKECGKSAAYNALAVDGRFSAKLRQEGKRLRFVP